MPRYTTTPIPTRGPNSHTLRACVVCGTPSTGTRCAQHRTTRRSLTTTERGYGTAHQQRRRALLAHAIGTVCPLCGQVMLANQQLDLDHTEPLIANPNSVGDRIVHANCNRGGGFVARAPAPSLTPHKDSRERFGGGR